MLGDVTWGEESTRRFFCCLGANFARFDFSLPELIEVMSLRGSDAVLCVFKESIRTTWVSAAALKGVAQMLGLFKSNVAQRKRQLSRQESKALQTAYGVATERASQYQIIINDFITGRDRAPSPLAWTAEGRRNVQEYRSTRRKARCVAWDIG